MKPAWEPIVLAMKPLDGTIAHNALTWGVAGMNIEASRIGTESTVRTRGDSLTDAGWSSTKRSPRIPKVCLGDGCAASGTAASAASACLRFILPLLTRAAEKIRCNGRFEG